MASNILKANNGVGVSQWRDPVRDDGVWAGVASLLPWSLVAKSALGVTLVLYVMNQKHLLPKILSRRVSKALFWPTLPVTLITRFRSWETQMDDTIILGGAPIGWFKIPERLSEQYNIKAVVNLCEEYPGPLRHYKKLGIKELWIPSADHFEPTIEDMETAVAFIQKHKDAGHKVYIHCRAGHGRSAAIAFAWLLSQDPEADLYELNQYMLLKRDVRKSLWKQANIRLFQDRLLKSRGKEMKKIKETDTKDKEL